MLTVEGGYVLGITAYWQGRLESARTYFEGTIERCRPEQRVVHLVSYAQDFEIVCLTRLAHTLWLLGEEEAAERARDRGLELAEERGHQYSRAVAHVFAAVLALDQHDEERLRRHTLALRSVISAYAAPQISMAADAFAGLLEVLDDGSRQAAGHVRSVVADARRYPPATPGFHALLVRVLLEAYARAGDAQAGLPAADEALRMAGGTQLWEAEIRRLRAGFLAAQGAPAREVEGELERAIAGAQRQAARAFELRARADLARTAT